jgi:hypothetical protein
VKLLVYMRDGRTCYALRGRGELGKLIRAKPDGEHPSLDVVKGTWNPSTGLYLWRPGIRLRFIAGGSISHVEEGDPNQAAPA